MLVREDAERGVLGWAWKQSALRAIAAGASCAAVGTAADNRIERTTGGARTGLLRERVSDSRLPRLRFGESLRRNAGSAAGDHRRDLALVGASPFMKPR